MWPSGPPPGSSKSDSWRALRRGVTIGGFELEDVQPPVDVWGGADDKFLDPGWPAELAGRIPDATQRIRSGGHFMAHLHWQEILAALRPSPPEGTPTA